MEEEKVMPKIMLAIPTYKFVSSVAMARLIGTIIDSMNYGYLVHVDVQADLYITQARNQSAAKAANLFVRGEITHLWMIDDDMLISEGALHKLLSRDVAVIGGAYYGRDLTPVAYKLDPYFKRYETIPGSGLIQVGGLGCGCTLIRGDVLVAMAERYNDSLWFQNSITVNDGKESYVGEDVFFFKRIHEMGIKTWLDCDVQCGHVGSAIVDRNMYELHQKMRDSGISVINPV